MPGQLAAGIFDPSLGLLLAGRLDELSECFFDRHTDLEVIAVSLLQFVAKLVETVATSLQVLRQLIQSLLLSRQVALLNIPFPLP